MLYAARSHIGLVRQINQDGFAVHEDLSGMQLVVLADGMGGASAGEVASKMAVEIVTRHVRDKLEEGTIDAAALLHDAIGQANRSIWETANRTEAYVGMGTTVVAVLIDGAMVYIGHVGDSRAYLYRDGELRQLTQDHSLVAELVRRGQLTEEEALHHPQRNIVTRSLGTLEHGHADIESTPWSNHDILLLCTDGLSNMMLPSELASFLKGLGDLPTPEDVERVADQMIRLALERGGTDNITLILVVHREEGLHQ